MILADVLTRYSVDPVFALAGLWLLATLTSAALPKMSKGLQ